MSRRSRRAPRASGGPDAFFHQSPESILKALDRPISEVVPDVKARAFRDAVEAVRKAQGAGLSVALVSAAGGHRPPMPARNAIEAATFYISVQRQCQRVVREWEAELPRRRTKNAALRDREGASSKLREQLHRVFPEMSATTLQKLVDTCVHREEASQDRAKLIGDYVGSLFTDSKVGASTIRAATSEARQARASWQPFLKWIETTQLPTLAREMAALSELLEWYRRWVAGPVPVDYYNTFGPLFLALLRMVARAPQSHPNAEAVYSWLRSLTDTEIAKWPIRGKWPPSRGRGSAPG